MLLPFSLQPTEGATGDPTSEPVPTPRTDESFLLSLTESGLPPPPSGVAHAATADAIRAVFSASPLAIVTLDRAGRVTLWNPAAETTFGWTKDEALGRAAPLDFLALCKRAFDGETITSLPVAPRKKDGAPVELRLSLAPLRDEQAVVTGLVAIFAPP